MLPRWTVWFLLSVVLAGCSSPAAVTPTPVQPTAAAALPTVLSGDAATQTAIAQSVNTLFTQTAVAGSAATRIAPANPTSVPITPIPEADQDPAYGARLWFSGILGGKATDIARYTCQAKAKEVSDTSTLTRLMMGGLNGFLKGLAGESSQTIIDLTHATFTVSSSDGMEATVHIGGEAYLAMGGSFQTSRLNYDLTMVYEDQRWKACGFVSQTAS